MIVEILLSCAAFAASMPSFPITRRDTNSLVTNVSDISIDAKAWMFDPKYDPHAIVTYDEETTHPQNPEFWKARKVGDWLIEYSVREGFANSPNYIADLLDSPAFHAPDVDCFIDSDGCTIDGGLIVSGMWSNNNFNALLVRAALQNYHHWFRSMYLALDATRTEMDTDIPALIHALLPAYTPPPTGFWSWSNPVFTDMLSLVTVFCPIEGVIADIAETAVMKGLQTEAEIGVNAYAALKESMKDLIDKTTKNIQGVVSKVTSAGDKTFKLVKDFAPLMPKTGPQSIGNPDSYLIDAGNSISEFQNQLGNVLDGILNNGFAQGGFIAQMYNGDWVRSYDTKSGDWQKDMLSQAKATMTQAIGGLTVSKALQDNDVILVKRSSEYSTQQDCWNSFNADDFTFARPTAEWCLQDDKGAWYPLLPLEWHVNQDSWSCGTRACQTIREFRGSQFLMSGQTFGNYNFSSDEYLSKTMQCSTQHGTLKTYDSEMYPSPDLSVVSPTDTNIKDIPCIYNTPVCDMASSDVQNGCLAYRQLVSDEMRKISCVGSTYRGPEFTYDKCTDLEMMRYCAQSTALKLGQTDITSIASAYLKEFYVGPFAYHWNGLYDGGCFEEKSDY